MKKTGAFLFLAMLVMPFAAYSQEASTGVGLTILDTTAPVINLTLPLNNSGNVNGNITFFYNVSDDSAVQNCSLIVGNKINITDTSIIKKTKIKFILNNTHIGRYNWSINCTDSLGFNGSSDARTFSVLFLQQFNLTTTNISLVNITNVTHFVIEESTAGKINFSESLDLSQGLDLDKYINVSFNRIELNSTALSALNKSATLYLYGLTFSNPRVVKDGIVCPSGICKEVSYSGGTFAFNVTHFTVYSSEETPGGGGDGGSGSSGGGGGGDGGGGGGGGGIQTFLDFTTDKKTIKVVLKQGQTKEETLSIKNTGTTVLDVTTYLQALKEFIISPSLEEIKTILNPNEEQSLNFVFGAEENLKPDVYTGGIKIKGGAIEKIINTIIEVESAKPLFDVDVEVLPQYKSIFPGEDVFMEVSLFNVRGFGRVDVVLEYSIRDFKGNIIATEHETVAVETQAKFSRELQIPADIEPGTYIASVKVTFEDSVGISSDLFEVKARAIRLIPVYIKSLAPYLLIGIIAVLFIVYIFVVRGFGLPGKKHAPKTKEEESKLLKTEEKIKKLEKELAASESAYKSGFISEESYKNNKERVEKELDKLRKE